MRTPSKLPTELIQPAFSVRQARDVGVTKARLRASDLGAPFHGIRSTENAATLRDRCAQYRPRLRNDQFFSHLTAAALYGIPLPRQLEERSDLDVSGRASRPRAAGVVGHRQPATPQQLVEGFPATHPAWLLPQLGTMLESDELIIAGDALVRRRYPFTSLDEIGRLLDDSHAPGVRNARAAFASMRPGTDSPMETRLRLLILRAGLPEPIIGHVIYSQHGDYIGRPDLAYVDQKIAIEYEGDHHRTDQRVYADDIERREQMQEAGWYVIRVVSGHIFRWPVWLANRIARVLAERTPSAASIGQKVSDVPGRSNTI